MSLVRPEKKLGKLALVLALAALAGVALAGSSFALTSTREAPAEEEPASPAKTSGSESEESTVGIYDSRGKRDPFLGPSTEIGRPVIEGTAGLDVESLELRGIVRTAKGFKAMVVGADQKTYFVTEGERFFNGTLVEIGAGALRFRIQDSHPLARGVTRDLVLPLHPQESPESK